MKYVMFFILMVFPIGAMQVETDWTDPSSLFKAVQKKDQKKVLAILNDQKNKNLSVLLEYQSHPQCWTPLLKATSDKNLPIAKLLIDAGADIFASDFTGENSFKKVFYTKQKEILKEFLSSPNPKQREKVLLALLQTFNKPNYVSVIDLIDDVIPDLVNKYGTHLKGYLQLQELAKATKQVAVDHPSQNTYVRTTSLYKLTSRFFLQYYIQDDPICVKFLEVAKQEDSYLYSLPSEVLNLVIEFYFYTKDRCSQQILDLVKSIEKKPAK